MKKIILAIFLILGAISFSAPQLDTNMLKKKGYEIANQDEQVITLSKGGQDYSMSPFYMSENIGRTPKNIGKMSIEAAPEEQKMLSSYETERAYIVKFKDTLNNTFLYTIVGKKQKVKGWYAGITYVIKNDLSKTELNKVSDNLLNEVESFIK